MDPTAILGVIIGVGLLVSAMGSGAGFESILNLFFHPPSIMIVLGGTIGAALVHFPMTQLFKMGSRLKVIFSVKRRDYFETIDEIAHVADKIKREGRLAINKDIEKIKDHFLKNSLQLFIDKLSPEQLEMVMRENINAISERHYQGILFFEQLAKYAPGFGLLGTLIGLIILLAKLDDPKTLGPNMSIALVTTFYGVLLSNLLFMPLAGRLRISSDEEIFQKEMMLKGIVSMANGDSSYIIREKMSMFLSEKERRRANKKTVTKKKK